MTIRSTSFASRFAAFAATFSLAVSSVFAQEAPPAPAPEGADGVEVLTRGVVHEAFAEVVSDPRPGLVVAKRPPEAIEEVAPEFKPEDDAAIWITGYWVWDDERDDYFWQSGVWRVPPPGMRWVAGYWNETPGGWQWVSGFWVPIAEKEIRYYDDPPASLEAGPTSPSPGDNYFWATGSWNYYDTGYRWQPGYWAPYQEDWVWISARYAWTPAGCVYLPPRWDYRWSRRGCMFAPVYFNQPIYLRPQYVYRPWCALNTPNLFVHLWVRPNYGHFYFGNYYGSNWGNWGVTPWCHYRPYRNCYDPVLTQLQCHYGRQGVNYINRLDSWHNHYRNNASHRPARTWNEQVNIVNKTNVHNTVINNTNITNITNIKQNLLAVNTRDESRRQDLPVKLARLDSDMQKKAREHVKETRDLRQSRIALERPAEIVQNAVNPGGNKTQPGPNVRPLPPSGGKAGGDLSLKTPRDERVNKPDNGQLKPRPVNKNVRLALPETVAADAIKGREKLTPPKLTPNARLSTPSTLDKGRDPSRRGERNPVVRPEPGSSLPQPRLDNPPSRPKVEVPTPGPKVETQKTEESRPLVPRPQRPERPQQPRLENPNPRPRVDVPNPQPKVEIPKPQPRVEVPRPQPRIETPRPQPRIESPRPPRAETPRPSRPQPSIERSPRPNPGGGNPNPRIETRERPQIKLDIPRPAPRVESAPRPQPAPRMESAPRIQPQPRLQPPPRVETPRSEPRNRGGENKPRGSRKERD